MADCKTLLENSGAELREESLVYLGSRSEDDVVYWAIDVSADSSLVSDLGSRQCCFVELRTLMVATDWADEWAMGELAVAGHVSCHGFSGERCPFLFSTYFIGLLV